jgi:hypothetical protein
MEFVVPRSRIFYATVNNAEAFLGSLLYSRPPHKFSGSRGSLQPFSEKARNFLVFSKLRVILALPDAMPIWILICVPNTDPENADPD